MENMIITKEDISFLVKQSTGNLNMVLSGMTALLKDNESKVTMLESQTWFQRMSRTLTGKNKMTQQEMQRNHDKINMYMTQAMTELYEQSCIDREIMMTLGNQINSLYAEHVQLKQILGAFATKLNEKIESVDNFHMLITELEQGIYKDKPKLVLVCEILSKLDGNAIQDERKLEILQRTLQNQDILDDTQTLIAEYLMDIVNVPVEDIGKIYLEMETISRNYIASLVLKMIEAYHFLPDMARKLKNKAKVVEEMINKESLDSGIALSIMEIYQGFVEEKINIISSFEIVEIESEKTENQDAGQVNILEEKEKIVNNENRVEEITDYKGGKKYFLIRDSRDRDYYIVSINPINWKIDIVKLFAKSDCIIEPYEIKDNIMVWVNRLDQCKLYWENFETKESGTLLTDGPIRMCSILKDKLLLIYGIAGAGERETIAIYKSDGSKIEKKLNHIWSPTRDSRIFESHGRYYYPQVQYIRSIDETLEDEQFYEIPLTEQYVRCDVAGVDEDGFFCYAAQTTTTRMRGILPRYKTTTVRNQKYVEAKGSVEYTGDIALQPQYNSFKNNNDLIEEVRTKNYRLYKDYIFSKKGDVVCKFRRADLSVQGYGQVIGLYDEDIFLGMTTTTDISSEEAIIKIDLRTERTPVIIPIEIPAELK